MGWEDSIRTIRTSMDYKTGTSLLHFPVHNTTPDTIASRTVKSGETSSGVSEGQEATAFHPQYLMLVST